MKMHDIAQDPGKVILLLHPILGSAELLRSTFVPYMGEGFRFLIPDLAAHGTASDQPYQSAAQEAKELAAYLAAQGITHIRMAYGASLGAVVLMELLRLRVVKIDCLYFEGASLFEHATLLGAGIKRVLVKKHRSADNDVKKVVQRLKALFGEETAELAARQFMAMDEGDIKNIVSDLVNVKLPRLSPQMQERCIFAYGDKDSDFLKARLLVKKYYPKAVLKIFLGHGHCEKLVKAPQEYVKQIKAFCEK